MKDLGKSAKDAKDGILDLLKVYDSLIDKEWEAMKVFDENTLQPTGYTAYFENGILLPIKIYLNKTFSLIMSINGKEFLKIYKFAFYILMMKRQMMNLYIVFLSTYIRDHNIKNLLNYKIHTIFVSILSGILIL